MRRPTRTRAGERGFTLIEVLVTLALLGILATAVGVLFSIGLRSILAPGASRDRLAAASDIVTFEELLTQDVHRAICIEVPGSTMTAYGSCAGETAPFQGKCTTDDILCAEWLDPASFDSSPPGYDMALYSYSLLSGQVTRSMWSCATQLSVTQVTNEPVTVSASVSVSHGASWPVTVDVTVTNAEAQLANPATVSFDLQPLSTQPWPADPVGGSC